MKTFILLLLPSFLLATVSLSPLYRKSSLPFVAKNRLGKTVGIIASLIVVADPIIILRNAAIKEALRAKLQSVSFT